MFTNRKARNRRRAEESGWTLPAIDWRSLAYGAAGIAVVASFAWIVVRALDNPIESVTVQGRFQRVSPMEVEQAVRERINDAGLVSVNLAALQGSLEALPWVDTVSVARVWPRGLQVRVVEQVAAARWGSSVVCSMRAANSFSASRDSFRPSCPACQGRRAAKDRLPSVTLPFRGVSSRAACALLRCASMRAEPGRSISTTAYACDSVGARLTNASSASWRRRCDS